MPKQKARGLGEHGGGGGWVEGRAVGGGGAERVRHGERRGLGRVARQGPGRERDKAKQGRQRVARPGGGGMRTRRSSRDDEGGERLEARQKERARKTQQGSYAGWRGGEGGACDMCLGDRFFQIQ